jgi:acetoacetyl-CoA reductase/3-oxoacyl-[acyl-carrier protein] reductase
MIQFKKNVLITGGSRGIGAGMVRAFAETGHNVFFTYSASVEKAVALESELSQKEYSVTSLKVDLQHTLEIEQLISSIVTKDIDILINNAAVLNYCDFMTVPMDVWERTQSVNVLAPALLSKCLLPHMMKREWGRIINMTSIGGQWGGTLAIPYAVSKSALIGLTRSLAKLTADHGITVNAISPGLVATDIIAGEIDTDQFRQKKANIPMGRIAKVEEIVAVALFLASDMASYITGQTINVNGGMYFG